MSFSRLRNKVVAANILFWDWLFWGFGIDYLVCWLPLHTVQLQRQSARDPMLQVIVTRWADASLYWIILILGPTVFVQGTSNLVTWEQEDDGSFQRSTTFFFQWAHFTTDRTVSPTKIYTVQRLAGKRGVLIWKLPRMTPLALRLSWLTISSPNSYTNIFLATGFLLENSVHGTLLFSWPLTLFFTWVFNFE